MSQHKQHPVRILNAAVGSGWTSHRRAAEYVRQGRARWSGAALEFVGTDPRHLEVIRSGRSDYDIAAHSGYANRKALRNLPMVGNVDLLLIRRSAA